MLIPRPRVVGEYNKYLCGVDRLDQNVALYRIAYKGKKWRSSIFTWTVDVCLQNAWQRQRKGGSNLSQKNLDDKLSYTFARYMVKIKNEQALQSIGSVKWMKIFGDDYSLRSNRTLHHLY